MKMHPKPMVRHTWPVITCECDVEANHDLNQVHLLLKIDGKTQRVCMNAPEAQQMRDQITDALRKLAEG